MKFSNQNRNRIIALLSMLAAGILIGQIFSTAERTVQAKVQKELADEVLRFHVLANSDSTLDQEMKLCVRNEILEFLQTEMPTGAGASYNICSDKPGKRENLRPEILSGAG